jgi:hypothetical protein
MKQYDVQEKDTYNMNEKASLYVAVKKQKLSIVLRLYCRSYGRFM